MIRVHDLSLSPGQTADRLVLMAAKLLRVPVSEITNLEIWKKSIDARKKDDIRIIYTVDVELRSEESGLLRRLHSGRITAAQQPAYRVPKPSVLPPERPVVVGFGPGGIFAALVLAEAGLRPIVLERGQDAETRRQKVERFWRTGALDPACNVQFGEGGAGTFSDGKLNTGIRNDRIGWVLRQFADAGAHKEILYDAKPHIGTDVLCAVVQNLRRRILSLGGEVRFGCRVTGLRRNGDLLDGVVCQENGAEHDLPCCGAVLAIGHSARDTFGMLLDFNIPMAPKPFSMGVRIEHRQSAIDRTQYGAFAGHPALPAADYKLACHLPDGSSAYTFCMCPGGYVVAAASEPGGVVTNGMSYVSRDGENANAALLITLRPEDFPDRDTLGGVRWQRQIEQAAFRAGGGDYRAPVQLVGDFLAGVPSTCARSITPTYRPGVTFCDLRQVLPEKITGTIARALPVLDSRLHGFADPDAVMTAPETRSSSPVRILRDDTCQSALRGLFPCGEGAGYAGGITSAAVDGMRCAEALIAACCVCRK